MRQRKLRLAALGLPSTHWASLALPHELSALSRLCPVDAVGDLNHDRVHFPLKSTIRSQALIKDADLEELWEKLGPGDWMQPLDQDLGRLLEGSIKDEYKLFL